MTIRPYQPTPEEAALIAWLQAQLGDPSAVVAIVANQSAAQPSTAFATVQVISRRRLGMPDARQTSRASGDGFEAEVFGEWEGTAALNFYGAAALARVEDAQASVDAFDVAQDNAAAGLYLRSASPILDLTAFDDVAFEARARFEVVFGFVKRRITATPAVDDVQISGEIG